MCKTPYVAVHLKTFIFAQRNDAKWAELSSEHDPLSPFTTNLLFYFNFSRRSRTILSNNYRSGPTSSYERILWCTRCSCRNCS